MDLAYSTAWVPYCGAAPNPTEWLGRWNFDPWVMAILCLGGISLARFARPRQRAFGLAGLAVLAVIFVSPLCALSSALFTARTVHHLLLVTVAAPALVWAMPSAGRGPVLAATLGQAVVFWAWHAPAAYGWALSEHGGYWLMQASLLGSSMAFWACVRRAPWPAALAGLLLASVFMGLLGALLTFAPSPLYVAHMLSAELWGLGPLRDQQVAGLLMWVPAAGLYLAVALSVLSQRLGGPAEAGARG